MGQHALDDEVFIRSMATRGHLGGLALATPEAVRVLDGDWRAVLRLAEVHAVDFKADAKLDMVKIDSTGVKPSSLPVR